MVQVHAAAAADRLMREESDEKACWMWKADKQAHTSEGPRERAQRNRGRRKEGRMARVSALLRFDSDRGRISTAGSRPGWRVASCGSPHELANWALATTGSFLHPIPLNCSNLSRGECHRRDDVGHYALLVLHKAG
eukprot:364994-Chlamydomonas_euryale.AAC.5